jgi:hypothetical protein
MAMTSKEQQLDLRYPVAFGSGLATALLFIAAWKQGTLGALVLAGTAPLPIMIATMGFGWRVGLGSAVAAALTFAALVAAATMHPFVPAVLLAAASRGVTFAIFLSLPTWALAWLASTGEPEVVLPFVARIAGKNRTPDAPPAGKRVTCPFGDVTIAIAATAFLIVSAMMVIWLFRYGSYEAALSATAAQIQPLIEQTVGARELPKSIDIASLPRLVIEIMPSVASAVVAFVLAINLWLAGRVAELSNRLPHPWPDIPHDLYVPRFAAGLFVICCGLTFLHGFAGIIAGAAAASLGVIFSLQGLAVLHDLSRGMRFRTTMLFALYIAVALLLPWPFVVLSLIGLMESVLGLRHRRTLTATTKQ